MNRCVICCEEHGSVATEQSMCADCGANNMDSLLVKCINCGGFTFFNKEKHDTHGVMLRIFEKQLYTEPYVMYNGIGLMIGVGMCPQCPQDNEPIEEKNWH